MPRNDPASRNRRTIRRWQFSLRSLLIVTLVVAIYSTAFAVESEDMRHLVLLVATFVFLGVFGIRWNRAAWVGFSLGATLGLGLWWRKNSLEPFHAQDRRFYLVVYTALVASAGMLVGFVYSVLERTRSRESWFADKQGTPSENKTPREEEREKQKEDKKGDKEEEEGGLPGEKGGS